MKVSRLVVVTGLVTGLFAAMPVGPANAATVTRYVSASGSGTACTTKAPCTLATAQSQVRTAARTMTGDLVVQLAGGTYSAPLAFNATDSGTGGHVVHYESAPGQTAIISGGRTITGWSVQDSSKNIWQASVPVGFTGRQLYVNGLRARIASERTSDALGALTTTSTGYRATNSAISTWTRPQDTEFVYPAGGYDANGGVTRIAGDFTWNMCSVNSVSGTAITMESACFRNGRGLVLQNDRKPPTANAPAIGQPTYIQNNYALLSEPGEFYLNSALGKLYYVPRPGENLKSATVVLAHEQNLLTATGTASNPVHDLQFTGLTFEYGTYVPDKQLGVLDFEGNLLENAADWQENDPSQLKNLPSNVAFSHAQRVLFQNNVLTHLGGGGVSFSGGGSGNSVIGNVVTDVSSSGISIGDMIGIQTPASYEGATVSNNYVHDVAVEFQGGAGIIVGWAQHTSVTHNEVSDVGFIGIQLGGASMTPNASGDNHIDYNYVHDVHSNSLIDGGAIYTTGWQSASPGSTITHNLISGDANVYGAIYLDGVSSYWRVNNNVVQHVANTSGWLYVQNLPLGGGTSDTATHNTVTANYTDTTRRIIAPSGDDPSNTIANNDVGLTSWPAAAQSIIAGAGLASSWQSIRGGASIVNLAYRMPVFASSNATTAAQANDGDTSTAWVSAAGDKSPAWETDLGAAKYLTKINVLTRQDADQPSAQNNFQVWVSNTPVISGTSKLACSQGADRLPFRETFTCNLPAGTWRYISLFKMDGAAYSIAEVQVFGHS